MDLKKNKLVSVLLVVFTALFLTGCSQGSVEDSSLLPEDIQNEVVEVTSEDIIEDIVVEDIEEDVELGELI
jgi:PBP1b-binding outer membrane lipoprotein LpoB